MRVPVKAEIFGQTYTISGELDEDYVLKLARFVDEKMRAVANATATVDTQKVAVLAALAIADELHSAQRDLRLPRRRFARTSRALPGTRRARPETIRLADHEVTSTIRDYCDQEVGVRSHRCFRNSACSSPGNGPRALAPRFVST